MAYLSRITLKLVRCCAWAVVVGSWLGWCTVGVVDAPWTAASDAVPTLEVSSIFLRPLSSRYTLFEQVVRQAVSLHFEGQPAQNVFDRRCRSVREAKIVITICSVNVYYILSQKH